MSQVVREPFGRTRDGREVSRFTLVNRRGSRARWIDWGATLTELWLPDRVGSPGDVVLGFDDFAAYESNAPHFGCSVGRVANRIGGAHFELDGRSYRLAANDGAHHLHGGVVGFDKSVWRAEERPLPDGPGLRFTHESPDGDEGYPGRLRVSLTVLFSHEDTLHLTYRAETDAPTLVNLTHHGYWNLAGRGDVLDHELRVDADHYVEVGPDLIPTGAVPRVEGTPFDFRAAKPVGRDIAELELGYDHSLVLASAARERPHDAIELHHPGSGRRLRIATTEPAVQLYTGNFLDGVRGKRGAVHDRHAGLCLETQRHPDAIHHPAFPSIVLRPGQAHEQVSVFRFSAAD